jgi:hypothetical protein
MTKASGRIAVVGDSGETDGIDYSIAIRRK